MIDYVKIQLLCVDINQLLNIHSLDFKIEVSERTGVCSTKRIAKYHFCKIVIYDSGLVLFTGSIHKFWNSLNGIKAPNYKTVKLYKGYNGNQFTFNNIIEVRKHLESLFDCTPQQMAFQNIEFGVNTTPLFNPIQYLKGLLYHKGLLFEFRYKGNFADAKHQQYRVKIYNKSVQYEMSEFTLRVEISIKKTIELKTTGIKTFADINVNALNKAKGLLLKRFDEVMHYDYTINKKTLTKGEMILIKDYSRPSYWIDETDSNHRSRPKKGLQKITLKHSKNLHQQIRQEIEKKCVIINRLL